jgi:hypothetical protein
MRGSSWGRSCGKGGGADGDNGSVPEHLELLFEDVLRMANLDTLTMSYRVMKLNKTLE